MKTLQRASNFWRPYVVDGKEINTIKIYDQTGIIYTTNCGWFEVSGYCGDVTKVTLNNEVKHARKLNFNRKDNFIIKTTDSSFKDCYDLYLYIDEFESVEHFEKVVIDNKDYIQRGKFATITFKNEFEHEDTELNKDTQLKHITKTAKTLTQLNGYYLPRELKQLGKDKERIEEKLKKIFHKDYINSFYLDEFMKEFKEVKK